jgi:hypothetical protein
MGLVLLTLPGCASMADYEACGNNWFACPTDVEVQSDRGYSYQGDNSAHFNPAAVYQPPIHINPDGQGGYSVYQQPNPFLMWR